MTGAKRMRELSKEFERMFPDWVPNVKEYKAFQRDVIVVILESGQSLVFMYKDQNDWHLGTKLYRSKPRKSEELE